MALASFGEGVQRLSAAFTDSMQQEDASGQGCYCDDSWFDGIIGGCCQLLYMHGVKY